MKKIVFITLYDVICTGPRLLSAIAKKKGIKTSLIIFKDQKTKAIYKDSKIHETYQFYADGIKHGSCYAAYQYTNNELELLVHLVKQISPDLICLSTRTFGYTASKKIINRLRESNLKRTIIGGGWGPTLEPEKFLEFCDYVCFGEGEKPFEKICDKLNNDESTNFKDVPNMIFFSDSGDMVRNSVEFPISDEDFNKLSFPDYGLKNKFLIDNDNIKEGYDFYNEKIYNCFASRGCPLNCSYCLSGRYKELYALCGHNIKKYRIRDVDTVINEMEEAKNNGAIYIRMNDEVFPINKEWVKRFIEMYGSKINLPFFAYIRPEYHSVEIIEKMAKIGLSSTVIGIQSGSEYIRREIFKRHFSNDNLISFANTLNKNKIQYYYHLINFNPFEKESDMIQTLNLLRTLPLGSILIFKLVPHPGTPIFKMIREKMPNPLPDIIQKRYGYLYTMTVKSNVYRWVSMFMHSNNLFRNNLFVFQFLFVPSLIKLHILKYVRKLIFGASTLLKLPISMVKKKK